MHKSIAVNPVQSAGKVLFAQPQGFWSTSSVRAFYEEVMGCSWPIDGPVRVEVSPSLVLRPASKGGFYVLEKVDGSWRCTCDGYHWRRACRHSKAEEEYHQPKSELIQGAFKPFLE